MEFKEYKKLLLDAEIIFEGEYVYEFTEFAKQRIRKLYSNERYKIFKCAFFSKNNKIYVYVPTTLENKNDAWDYVAVSDTEAYENGVRNMLEIFKDYIDLGEGTMAENMLTKAIKLLEKTGYIVEHLTPIHPSQLLATEKAFSKFAEDLNKNVFPYEDWKYKVSAVNNPKHLHSCIEIKLKDLDRHSLNVATIDHFIIDGKMQFSISPSYKNTIKLGDLPKNDVEWEFIAEKICEIVDEFIAINKKNGII